MGGLKIKYRLLHEGDVERECDMSVFQAVAGVRLPSEEDLGGGVD
jgi:hypothetical protein